MKKLGTIELTAYINAMKEYARSVNADYVLSINRSFIEMWDCIEREDDDNELQLGFYKYRDAYLDVQDIDIDILAMSFIKNGGFEEYINSDT